MFFLFQRKQGKQKITSDFVYWFMSKPTTFRIVKTSHFYILSPEGVPGSLQEDPSCLQYGRCATGVRENKNTVF